MNATVERLTTALSDRYSIERELGAGGMATVYLARDIRHDRLVALKVLRPELAAVIGADRFLTEIRTTANLQHPHILPLHDSGEADGFLFYVMPYVQGETVRDRISREKQLPVDDAIRIASEIASALDYAHRHGVIHRDVKPENILLHDGAALVADFGIALAASKAGDARMTETGMSVGTPHYMSPEQAMGERDITARSDVYALGCVLYEMLLGEPPFTGPTAQSIVAKVLSEKPQRMLARRERIPPQVEDAVFVALEKLPADRFGTAAAFADALHATAPVKARTGVPISKWSSRLRLAIPVAMVALAVGFGAGHTPFGAAGPATASWSGEILGGPRVAFTPRISSDGEMVAFGAMVDAQTQVGVLRVKTGDWKILTTDRTRGAAGDFSWARDDSKIYFSRFSESPKGVFSITPLGTDERLVLADAAAPDVLPDGSLLVARLNANRQLQLYRYWAATGKIDTLAAVAPRFFAAAGFFKSFPDGREAAFFGRSVAQADTADHLWAIDLKTNKVRRLAPAFDISRSVLAMTPDGKSVVVNYPVGNEFRLVAVPRDGSNHIEVLSVLTSSSNGIDMDRAGNLYIDQGLRTVDLHRFDPATGHDETWQIPNTNDFLLLPDGRVLTVPSASGGFRVVALKPGGEQLPFMDTDKQTHAPMTVLGSDRVVLMVGAGPGVATIVSIATGQIVGQLPDLHPTAMAGSPDGKTLYYAQDRVIWAVAATGGKPRRIRDGDGVAADPAGRYVIVQVFDRLDIRLFHVPLDGTPETEIVMQSDMRVSPVPLSSSAIRGDGRIVLSVVLPSSWYWPLVVLDPRSGRAERLPIGIAYDMAGSWDSQGRIVYTAQGQESNLWRLRPSPSGRVAK